jgi:hypothetical protein
VDGNMIDKTLWLIEQVVIGNKIDVEDSKRMASAVHSLA